MSDLSLDTAESDQLNSQIDIFKKRAIPALLAFAIASLILKYYD